MTIAPDHDLISLDELASTLRAFEGPSRARRRVRSRAPRSRRVLLSAAAAGTVALGGTIAGLYLTGAVGRGSGRPPLRHVALPPLPPGPQKLDVHPGASADLERVSLDDMIKRAPVAFVGTVSAIGGREVLGASPLPMEAYRIRFEVERVLRGEPVDTIDITDLALAEETFFPAEVGEKFLVFAEWRELSESRVRRLVGFGYSFGVFRVAGDKASNPYNGTVDLDEAERRVMAGRR